MLAPYRIEGFAIISSDGAIAASDGLMPPALLNPADKDYYSRELDRMDVVIHGRNSHEGQPHSSLRRRLIATRKVATVAPDPDYPNALFWNPAGLSFEEACRELGTPRGAIGVLGGTDLFDLFLGVGYDVFHLARSEKAVLPGGPPVFSQLRLGVSPDEVLTKAGLEPGPKQVLDEAAGISVVAWTPRRASARAGAEAR